MKRIISTVVTVVLLSLGPVVSNAQEETAALQQTAPVEMTQAQKDSVLLSKLTPDQLMELKKMEMEVEKERIEAQSKEDMPLNGLGIVLIVLAPFLFVIGIIVISNRAKQAESKRRYEIYMKSIELGQPVPEHFFEEPDRKSKSSNLQRGIIAMMVGLAFGIYVIVSKDTGLIFMMAALIPGLVGVGYILVHFLEKPKTENAVSENEQN